VQSQVYPWMQDQWQQLVQQYQANRLPHALLFSGPEGVGKYNFARLLVETLLCDENNPRNHNPANEWKISPPCGKCNGCQLLAAGTHPDSYTIRPETEGKQIQIASIREINQFVSLTSQFAPLQAVIISPAEAMNRSSANALLKTLEEPRPGKLIILISSQPSRLLPTIKSRCQQISFALPANDLAMTWLAERDGSGADRSMHQRLLTLAGGAPLLAMQYMNQGKLELYQQLLQSFEKLGKKQVDPVAEAKRWEAAGLAHCVKWLYLWVSSLIHLKSITGVVDTTVVDATLVDKTSDEKILVDKKIVENNTLWREPVLDFLIDKTSSASLYAYLDQLIETARVVNTPVNVQLTLENLLMAWSQRLK